MSTPGSYGLRVGVLLKSVTIKERNGCWARTKYRKMDFCYAEKYGVELANGRSKTTGDGRRLILFLALITQQKV